MQQRGRSWSDDFSGTTGTLEATVEKEQLWRWRKRTTLRRQNVPVPTEYIGPVADKVTVAEAMEWMQHREQL